MNTRIDENTIEGKAKIFDTVNDARIRYGKIYVRHWGATMTLADFYVIKHVDGSKNKVAIELQKEEYGEFGVSERAIPTENMSMGEIHAVREKKHGEHTGLAPDIQISFSGKWETVRLWDGNPEIQNTCD